MLLFEETFFAIFDVFTGGEACCMSRLIGYFMHMHEPEYFRTNVRCDDSSDYSSVLLVAANLSTWFIKNGNF